ncbi:MAG: hypothetical protein RIT43_210 [Bacteroidota bacterium]
MMRSWTVRFVELFPLFAGFAVCYLLLQLAFLQLLHPAQLAAVTLVSVLIILGNIGLIWLGVSLLMAVSPESLHAWIRRTVFILLYLGIPGTLICDQYVLITHERLDEAVFLFEWSELWMIANPLQRLNVWSAAAIVLVMSLPFGLYYWLRRSRPSPVLLISLVSLFSMVRFFPVSNDLGRLAENRFAYFVKRCVIALSNRDTQNIVKPTDFRDLDTEFYGGHQHVQPGNPLAHTLSSGSVLAEYLHRTSTNTPPQIKIIIVESMSSDLFGQRGNNTGVLMPFLDSLSKKSLYFPNGFSTYQRTHNVLPAVLASIPNTIDGNVFQQLPFPKHYSLFNLLDKYYYTQFYCGVPLSYLNMVGLMSHYDTDYQIKTWSRKHLEHKDMVGNSWGFPDEDVFQQAHFDDSVRFTHLKHPALKVFLTISSHDPFIYPNKEKWKNTVLEKSKNIKDIKLKSLARSQAADFGSFCYVDSVLKSFFSKETQKPDFRNTIYIITGDHGTELYRRNALSKYNVPLMIYSPLLKTPRISQAFVSHNDLAPTLINYLKTAYKLPLPDTVAFVGKELKISNSYKPDRKLVFTTNKLRTTDLLSDKYAWIGGKLFMVDSTLNLKPLRQPKLEKWVKQQLHAYQAFSRYTLIQDHLIDSISYTRWVGKTFEFKRKKKRQIKTLHAIPGMNFLESHFLKTKHSTIRIEVDCQMYLNKISELNDAPNLVVQSRKTHYLSKKWTIFRLVKPRIKGNFKPKDRNHVVYSLEFKPKDIAVWKKGGFLHLYLQHSVKHPIHLKDVTIQIFHQEE